MEQSSLSVSQLKIYGDSRRRLLYYEVCVLLILARRLKMARAKGIPSFVIAAVACGAVALSTAGVSFADGKGKDAHRHYKGEVVEKAGNLSTQHGQACL